MTAEEIRTLDGEALTALAWQLGLAPTDAIMTPSGAFPRQQDRISFQDRWGHSITWAPHVDLAQAQAVFLQLRARGWTTKHLWDAEHHYGSISICDDSWPDMCCFGNKGRDVVPLHPLAQWEASEAMALLRLACLAAVRASRP